MFPVFLIFSVVAFFLPAVSAQGNGSHFIHPNGNITKCLDVRGGLFDNGTPVQIFDCNGTSGQRWDINSVPGFTHITVHGTNFCLDAGETPASGVGMKIWTCFADLAAQNWFLLNQTIAILNLFTTSQCLDLSNGVLDNSNQVQTWACSPNNPNQVWTLE